VTTSEETLVTVVIPAYNAERFIGTTMDSALRQSHRDIEVIVVEDGSTDRTAAIVESKAASDGRIRLLHQSNSGVAAARNRGLAAARGAFFAPLDADDLWHSRKIELQLTALRKGRTDVALAYCWSCIIDENDRIIGKTGRGYAEGHVLHELVAHNFIGNASVPLIRTEMARRVGGYQEELFHANAQGCEDLHFHFAIAERWALALVPQTLVGYRQAISSMSMDVERMKRSRTLVLKQIADRHPEIHKSLFRLYEQRSTLAAAAKFIRSGRLPDGYRLIAAAARRDPALPFRRYARPYLRRMLRAGLSGWAIGSNLPQPYQQIFSDEAVAREWQTEFEADFE
jgi:glycosyltransferase involved in cell wall biosynthesis